MSGTDLAVVLGDCHYVVDRPWGVLPTGMEFAVVSDVALDSRDRVYVCQRGDPPVLVFDPSGALVHEWGTGAIVDAHGIAIGPDDLVLVVDRDAHQVLGFDLEGNLLLVLGERHRPRFQAPFNHPTDVAVAGNGDIYVSDGYGNSSVHRFSADGDWLQSWGSPGVGPGQFTTPHAIWIDASGRVLVADRENNRVQYFTAEGEYRGEWRDLFHPMDIYADRHGMVYVTDQIPRLSMVSSDGKLVGRCRPVLYGAHGVWGDSRGNLFLAEAAPLNRITRLVLEPQANAATSMTEPETA